MIKQSAIIVRSHWNTLPLSPIPMLDDTINARIYFIFPTTLKGGKGGKHHAVYLIASLPCNMGNLYALFLFNFIYLI